MQQEIMLQNKELTLGLVQFVEKWRQLLDTGLQDTVQLASTAQTIEAHALHYTQLDNNTYAELDITMGCRTTNTHRCR